VKLSVPANRITQIIQGKRAVTGDTALRLGHWLETSAQFWLNLQAAYDIKVAQSLAIGLTHDRRHDRARVFGCRPPESYT